MTFLNLAFGNKTTRVSVQTDRNVAADSSKTSAQSKPSRRSMPFLHQPVRSSEMAR